MKKLLGGVALSLCLAVPATAADLRRPMPVKAPPPVVEAVFSWTGCYIGGHVGGLWGRTKWENAAGNDATFTRNDTGKYTEFTGGGHLGCNYQVNNFVFGIEGDASWTRVNQFQIHDIVNLDEIRRTKFDWYASVRGRLGIAWARSLIYGTGGVAFTQIRMSYENYTDATRTVLDESNTGTASIGWVAGGGWEYALTNNWIGRAEYLHYQFSRREITGAILGGAQQYGRPSFDVVRIGLSYKFGGSPVVARY